MLALGIISLCFLWILLFGLFIVPIIFAAEKEWDGFVVFVFIALALVVPIIYVFMSLWKFD